MGAIPVVKGKVVRASKIDSCGKPIQGPKNRVVTDGAIRVNLSPEMKAAEDIEQTNFEGKVCVSDRTPPERKWYNAELQFCGVDPELFSLLTGYPLILDHDDNVIGYRDRKAVEADFGAMIEVWTGGKADDDCPTPTSDSIFSAVGSGKSYGYLKFGGTEWTPGDFTVEAGAATFTLTGRTIETQHWGRGPYNVMWIDDTGNAGRLLVADNDDAQLTFFRTRVEPPTPTDGACELAVQSIFSGTTYYYGGPAGAAAADVAPPQPICGGVAYAVEVTGTGNWTALVGSDETANIAHTALPTAVQSAIEALPTVAPGQVQVSGTAGDYTVTLDPSLPALTADSTGLSGGTATVTPA